MTNQNRILTAVLFGASIPIDAHAVDGAGLLEVFPAFRWIVLLPLCSVGAWGAWRAMNSVLAQREKTTRIAVSTLVSLVPLIPIAVPIFVSAHTKYLCSSEAFAHRYVPLETWMVPAEPFRSMAPSTSATKIASGVYSHTHNAGLTEIIGSEEASLGVVSHFNRLVDASNGTLLAESRYFSDGRRPPPFGCERSEFWQWRNEYIEKARREASKTAVAN